MNAADKWHQIVAALQNDNAEWWVEDGKHLLTDQDNTIWVDQWDDFCERYYPCDNCPLYKGRYCGRFGHNEWCLLGYFLEELWVDNDRETALRSAKMMLDAVKAHSYR